MRKISIAFVMPLSLFVTRILQSNSNSHIPLFVVVTRCGWPGGSLLAARAVARHADGSSTNNKACNKACSKHTAWLKVVQQECVTCRRAKRGRGGGGLWGRGRGRGGAGTEGEGGEPQEQCGQY